MHGVKHLEEIAESWLCARRTLHILSTLVKSWKVELPEEAVIVLARTDSKFGPWEGVTTPKVTKRELRPLVLEDQHQQQHQKQNQHSLRSSPTLQPYGMSLANTAAQFFQRNGTGLSSAGAASLSAQPTPANNNNTTALNTLNGDTRALSTPDLEALSHILQQSQSQTQPTSPNSTIAHTHSNSIPTTATPSSNNRQSMDSSLNARDHASPSQLFGGVEQLMREGQDWWLNDQNQLAMGFDNWGYSSSPAAAANLAAATTAAASTAGIPAGGAGTNGVGLNGVGDDLGGGAAAAWFAAQQQQQQHQNQQQNHNQNHQQGGGGANGGGGGIIGSPGLSAYGVEGIAGGLNGGGAGGLGGMGGYAGGLYDESEWYQ